MKVRHVDWYADEWISGTAGLSLEERGLYDTIINLIYSNGGPIKDDEAELSHRCRCHWRTLRGLLKSLQDGGKIVREHGHVMVTRCSRELEKASKRTSQAVENGLKGGRHPKKNNSLAEPDGFGDEKLTRAEPKPKPPTTNQEESPDGDSLPAKGKADGRRKPKQGFPADWFPSERGVEFAHGEGRDDAWIGREGPACRDFHIGKGNLFADHDAAWRTWVHNAARFEPVGSAANQRSGSGGPGHSRIAAALSRVHLKTDVPGIH